MRHSTRRTAAACRPASSSSSSSSYGIVPNSTTAAALLRRSRTLAYPRRSSAPSSSSSSSCSITTTTTRTSTTTAAARTLPTHKHLYRTGSTTPLLLLASLHQHRRHRQQLHVATGRRKIEMSGLSRKKLEGEERERRLREEVPYWRQASGRDAIQRTFTFKDFKEAWRFMSLTADKAEEMDHHPEWFNVYNRVEVTLATHTCSGVSEYDVELAKAMDQFALQTSDESAARE